MKKVLVAALVIVLVGLCVGSWELRHRNHPDVASKANVTAPLRTLGQTSRDPQGFLRKFAQVPLSFEPNRGQFDPRVKFVARGADYGLFLSGGEATIVHHGTIHLGDGDVSSMMATLGNSEVRTLSATQLTWLGANSKAEPQGMDRQASESNYFIGRDPRKWRRHVRHYDRVQLTGLYRGIDLVYHGSQKQVEFDYVVAPHVSPTAIRVGISGPSIVGLEATGQLSISSSGDKMLLLPPTAYQEKNGRRERVEAHYVLSDSHQFGFQLGKYDASRPVVIDPVLQYAASFGPNVNDTIATDVALDASGNVYITGTTCETNYPTTTNALQPTGGSNLANFCNDVIVTKLDSSVSRLIYSTYIGGQTGVDFAVRMLIDSAGAATVVGTTGSTDFPTTAGVYQSSAKGGSCDYGPNVSPNIPCTDAFLLKLSADGSSLEYSTYFGGERAEFGIALAQDSAGNSYVAGATDSTALPLAGSPFQGTYGGGGNCQGNTAPCFDGFIAKFNPTGTQLLASTYLGGNKDDMVAAVALDAAGDVYVTGVADSTNFPTTAGSIQTVHAGTSQGDAFLSKLDGNLHTLQYSTFLGGTADDIAFAVRVDGSGAAYLTGSTLSSDFPTTAGAYQTKYKGPDPSTAFCISGLDTGILVQPTCGDVFISKIDPSKPSGSQLIFSTFLGGSGNDFAYNLELDSQNNVWVVGDTNSVDFPYTSDAYFATQRGPMFLSEIKNDGSQLIFSTGLTASGSGLALGIDIDLSDNVYVTGQGTVSATPGTYGLGQPGEVFVAKYASGTAQPAVTLSATSLSFSGVTNSATAPQSVTLTNSGTGTLHLLTTLVNGTNGNPLAFSEGDNCPASIPAGGMCTINVTYLPTASNGNGDGATVQILDDAPGAPHLIQLSGTNGLTTSTSFVPATLSFPGQQPGVASPSQMSGLNSNSAGASNIFATNTGAPVLSGPNPSEFKVDESQCVAKAIGCFVSVTFTPAASATGTQTATLTVPTNAPNSPQVLALIGTVATGPFAVLTVGAQNATTVGQTLNTDLFVKNTGGGSLNVTGFNITGANASDFAVSPGDCGPALTLAPQAACFVNLAFTPGATGNRTATITLADNETTPASLTLNGTGAAAGGPQINSNTFGTTVFSDTTVGQNTSFSPVFTATLTNFGTGANASAHVTAVTLTGDFMSEAPVFGPTCTVGFVLAGNQGSCGVGVFFAPTAVGLRTGTLKIQTDAPGTPSFSFTFTGNGIQTAAVLLTPSTLNFGKEVVGGTTSSQPVTLKNTGNGPLNISGMGISGPFTQTTTCGASLAAGTTCVFTVKFSPTAAGAASGLITFTGNAAGGGSFAVGLSGTGATGPTPQAVPASLTFGNQAVNTVSPPQIVTLSNAGDMAFSFLGVRASENYSATSNCPSSIGPGVTCNISITFSPTPDVNTGFTTGGSVFVTTNAPGSPFMIPVSGVATQSTGATTLATIASSLNPSTVGQSVTFTATITSTTPGTPTGTVTFLDNGNALGAPVALSAGKAMFTTTSLAQGNHSIFCMYSGDATFAPATSSGIGQMVEATSSTAVVSSVNPSSVGQTVVFTATVSSTAPGTITGNIVFFDGASQISNPVSISGGSASLSISSLTQGAHSITAQYSGNPSYAVSTSPAITQTVNAATTAATSTTVVSSLNPATVGQSVMFTATSTSATAGTLTGTITFFDGATQIGAPVTISSGSASVSTTTLTQAAHSITAKYSGDAKFSASTSPTLTETVNVGTKAATSSVVTSSLNPSTTGASVPFTATVSSATAGTITGTVTFLDGATSLGMSTVGAGGKATLMTSALAQGSHSITAQYGGDANFAGDTSPAFTETVNAAALIATTTMLTGPAAGTTGASVSFMASVTPASGTKVPTGTVTFLDGATTLGPGTLNGSGSATFATSTLAAGMHSITAQYGGDANFAMSTSMAVSTNITAATGSFTLSATPSNVTVTALQPGMAVITVMPANGFNQVVQFSCSNVPEGVDCEFQPHSVTPNGAPVTAMLAVTEEAENGARRRAGTAIGSAGRGGSNAAGQAPRAIFVPLLACELMLLAGVWRRRKSTNSGSRFQVAYALLLLMTVMTFVAGCTGSPKLTSGTTIIVLGTGPNNQTASVPITVTIQK
jgi:Bacterial Ig-like domain (group 3)/Abnormal spindle-like microcephaly-assoc'd, ASPM-SPD-2-Hydin